MYWEDNCYIVIVWFHANDSNQYLNLKSLTLVCDSYKEARVSISNENIGVFFSIDFSKHINDYNYLIYLLILWFWQKEVINNDHKAFWHLFGTVHLKNNPMDGAISVISRSLICCGQPVKQTIPVCFSVFTVFSSYL